VFLQHLDTAFYHYLNEDEPGLRSYDWYLGVFRQRIEHFRQRCAAALEVIQQAIRDGHLVVDVAQQNLFLGTELNNEFVYQSYWNEHGYFVSGLMRKLITLDGLEV